jgi:hypothetical protein
MQYVVNGRDLFIGNTAVDNKGIRQNINLLLPSISLSLKFRRELITQA